MRESAEQRPVLTQTDEVLVERKSKNWEFGWVAYLQVAGRGWR